jgi:phenylpropionate dioxygenase-like ring-hydroxylating dioxygenase large terminal subunit
MSTEHSTIDPVIRNAWQVVGAFDELVPGEARHTQVLGTPIAITRSGSGDVAVRRHDDTRAPLPALIRYGYVWTSLGDPPPELFPLPEFAEPDRRNLNAASFGVHVSAPRAIENFLDMGHFPFVHTDILGAEPHTEVRDYQVEVSKERDEILATRCFFYQPQPAAGSSGGADVEYVYRVPHPYCSVLYKSSAGDPSRMDVIALFLQPVDEEHVCAHMLLSLLDEQSSNNYLRHFQQMIFAQDKPILENQMPKRLPLDPAAETPIRADAVSVLYRRWLRERAVTYGAIPARA